MRQGFSPELEPLIRCADPIAVEKIFAEVELAADYVRRKDQFSLGTVVPVGGLRPLDDGIRLDDSLSTKIENVSTLASITDLDRDSPWSVAVVFWRGGDPAELEIHNVRCRLDPGGGGNDVATWRMWLHTVVKREEGYLGATPAIFILPIAFADVANGGATLPGDFTFDFTNTLPRPLREHPFDFDDAGVDASNIPTLWLQVLALKTDGSPATFGSWVSGGADVVTGGNTLTGRKAEKLAGDLGGVWRYTGSISPPNLSIRTSGYVTATVEFDNPNWLDLGAVPTKTVRFETLERIPFGTSVVYEVRNDANTAWVVFKDGDTTADLAGVGLRQQYRFRIILTPNGAGNLTPHVVSVGVKELTETDLSDVAQFVQQALSIDPVTLKGSIGEASVVAIRDGELDFNDRMTTVLAGNQFGKIQIRRFIAAEGLARDRWLHMDDWLLEDYELAGPRISLSLVSVLAILKRRLPSFDTASMTRKLLQFNGVTLKAAFESLLQTHLLVPDRRFGPGIEDTVTTVSTEIDDSDGKTEADALTTLAGGALIASQGTIKFVDLLSEKEIVQRFVFEELSEVSVTPGFRQRIPVFFVPFSYNFEKRRFLSEIRRIHGLALLNLDIAPVDAPDRLEDAPAKWIDQQPLAEKVAQRTVDSLGTGMILFRIRSAYAYPELEPGDLVAIETDRFVARDPNLTARGLKGSIFARGVIQEVADPWGRELTIWVRSYADLLSAAETVTVEGLAQPVVEAVIPAISGDGDVSVNVKITDALSVKIAHSTTAFPTAVTVRAETAIAVDTDGNLTTLLRNISETEELFISVLAFEKADGTGKESVDLYKVKSDERETVIFGDVDVDDGFSTLRNAAAPEIGDVIVTAEGGTAFSNLEDANLNLTTYRVAITVDWNKGGSLVGLATVTLASSSAAMGGVFTDRDSVTGDSAEPTTTYELLATVTLGVDFDLRLTLTYAIPGSDAGKSELTAHGETNAIPGVQFKKKGVRVSSTRIVLPVGVDKWQIE